jgi:hypothetical protein
MTHVIQNLVVASKCSEVNGTDAFFEISETYRRISFHDDYRWDVCGKIETIRRNCRQRDSLKIALHGPTKRQDHKITQVYVKGSRRKCLGHKAPVHIAQKSEPRGQTVLT